MSGFNNVGKGPVGESLTTNISGPDSLPKGGNISADDVEKLFASSDDKGGSKTKDTFSSQDTKEEKEPQTKSTDKKDDKDEKKETEDKDEIELFEEEEVDGEEETTEESESDDNEDAEDKEDDSEEKPEEKEELEIEAPPNKRKILAKYPEFFKEFPFFDKMMFRDKWYSENFGSMAQAKETLERVEQFGQIEEKLFTGDISHVLSGLKESDEKAYNKVIDNWINVLETNDKDAFNDVANNLVKRVIAGMVQKSKSKEDKDLFTAADILHEFFFDKPLKEFEPAKTRVAAEEKDDAAKKLEEERNKFVTERFEIAKGELDTKINNVLSSTIDKYIDPKGNMSPYERKTAIADALRLLHGNLGKDKNFKNNLDKLWKVAFGSKFKQADLDKIKSSYLGRAKGELSDVIRKVRAEVLKGRERNLEDKKDHTSRERKTTPGRPRETNKSDKKVWDKKTQTVEDFLST